MTDRTSTRDPVTGEPPATILVVEDQRELLAQLRDALKAQGYEVLEATDGEAGLERAASGRPDLIILDLMLPKLDGIEVCRRVRERGMDTPIIMLTARSEEGDRVDGFRSGADDYVTKPFSVRELMLRVRAMLRRAGGEVPLEEVRMGEALIDFKKYTIFRGDEQFPVSEKEVALLRLLIGNPHEVISRDRLLDEVWGFSAYPSTQRAALRAPPIPPARCVDGWAPGERPPSSSATWSAPASSPSSSATWSAPASSPCRRSSAPPPAARWRRWGCGRRGASWPCAVRSATPSSPPACRPPAPSISTLRRVYGPRAGFLSGTVSFAVGFAAATAAASLGAVAYGAALLPGWDPAATLLGFEQGALAAAGFIVLTAALHSRGVGVSGRLQAALATLIVAGVVAFVVLGFAGGRGSFAALTAGGAVGGAGGGWWIAFLQVSFAYSGWNAAAYLAEEVDEPARTLPRALIGGTLLVTAVYLALNAVFFYALPDAAWGATIAIGRDAALALFGREVATALSGLVGLAILGSVSAMAAAGPRVYFAMARDGLAPSVVARVNPHNGAPVVAIWAQAVLAATLALTGAFEALLVYIGSALLLFAAAAVAALLILRWRERESSVAETDGGRGKTPHGSVSLQGTPTDGGTRMFRAPGGPIPAGVFLAAATLAWINGLLQQPVPTLAALATIGAGALLYTIGSRRGWLRRSPCES